MNLLENILERLNNLPKKEKTELRKREAVAFLYPGIEAALQKNYTRDEINNLIIAEGWPLNEGAIKRFWKLFRAEAKIEQIAKAKEAFRIESAMRKRADESSGHKAEKISHSPGEEIAASPQLSIREIQRELETQDSGHKTKDETTAETPSKGAYFNVEPDSDVL